MFLSSWISLFQLKLNRHPVSNQAENFGPSAQVLLFRCTLEIWKHFWISSGMWVLSSLDDVFFESLYCANALAGGRHAADKPFDPSESPTSCNHVFQLSKCYPQHTQHLVPLRSLPFLISNSIIIPASQCAASHFPKKKRVLKRSLDGYTTAQDFTVLFSQTFRPFLSAL